MKRILVAFCLTGFLFALPAYAEPARPGQTPSPVQGTEVTEPETSDQVPEAVVPETETKPVVPVKSKVTSAKVASKGSGLVIKVKNKSFELPLEAPKNIIEKAGSEKDREMMRQNWAQFLDHVRGGGKWTLNSYGGRVQTGIDLEGILVIKRTKISGPKGKHYLPLGDESEMPHGHLGIFTVPHGTVARDVDHISTKWKCPMDNSLFYWSGHAIHACLENLRYKLGRADSHGCTRNVPETSKWRFGWVGDDDYFVWVTDNYTIVRVFNL